MKSRSNRVRGSGKAVLPNVHDTRLHVVDWHRPVNCSLFSDGFLNMRLLDSTQLGLSRPVRRHQDLDEHREKEDDETLP